MVNALFKVGDFVRRHNQPDMVGLVTNVRWDDQVETWNCQVQFGAHLRTLPQDSLVPFRPALTPWDRLREGLVGGHPQLVSLLTFHRLRRPPARIAYSLSNSRTQLYPYQFKPLLKFLDHPGKRILIADDVGLGKTIEAGYILRELQARGAVERVLVVVPARLVPKWKRELRNRFDMQFESARRADLLRLAEGVASGKEPDPFRWITSYESARDSGVREAWEETQPQLDVLVCDEAHRMRNQETLQHRMGRVLARTADAAIFLSATPVQNRLDDLFSLLSLLDPDSFSDVQVFAEQIEANRVLLDAQRQLAGSNGAVLRAAGLVEEYFRSPIGRQLQQTELGRSVTTRLKSPTLSRRDVVELQADLGRLSPLGDIITRTRKADALPDRAQRRAWWTPVHLSPQERAVYDLAQQLCSSTSNSWGVQMVALMNYRITASCIPAAVRYFREKLGSARAELLSNLIEEQEEEAETAISETTSDEGAFWQGPSGDPMRDLVNKYGVLARGDQDAKYTCFKDALTKIWEEDGQCRRQPRKVVVFSFFRRTLEYLRDRLGAEGMSVRMIHGLVDVDDRERYIDEFLERDDVRVLLTSDVGGEGIDLQKASVVVNYDLPWNPMVVEQRIGRVDRIGQQSESIVVINLVVAASIEERILQRLLGRVGIFQASIGELDPIIGEQIETLTREALVGGLTREEIERRVNDTSSALERRVIAAREMLRAVDGILAADQALIDEIAAVQNERQIPASGELLGFLNGFLAKEVPGSQIPAAAMSRAVSVDLREAAIRLLDGDHGRTGPEATYFLRRAVSGPIEITLSRDVAYRHPRVELIHLAHPLVMTAVNRAKGTEATEAAAFSIGLDESRILKQGTYAFLLAIFEIGTHQPKTQFVATYIDFSGRQQFLDTEQTAAITVEMLDRGRSREPVEIADGQLEILRAALNDCLDRTRAERADYEKRLDVAREELQQAALKTVHEVRVERERRRLLDLQARSAGEFAIRMSERRLEKAERALAGMAGSRRSSWGGVEVEEIAAGFLHVGSAECPS